MLQEIPGSKRVTVAGDKGFGTADFVRECRSIWVTPQVAQNLGREVAAPSTVARRGTRAMRSVRRRGSASKNVLAGSRRSH